MIYAADPVLGGIIYAARFQSAIVTEPDPDPETVPATVLTFGGEPLTFNGVTVDFGLSAGLSLSWDGSPDPAVTSYKVYYGTAAGVYNQAPGEGLPVGNVTTYVLEGLAPGTYYIAVTGVTASGDESTYSDEFIATW